MKKLTKSFLALITALSVTSGVSAATTDTTSTDTTITTGSLSIAAPGISTPFSPINLNGSTQSTTAGLGYFSVGDATGTGDGWHVTVQASQFTDEVGNVLPLGSLVLNTASSVLATGGTASPSPSILPGPFVIDDGTSYNVVSAALNEGMGNYNVSFPQPTLTLNLNPATTFVDNADGTSTYTSTLTWTIVTGP